MNYLYVAIINKLSIVNAMINLYTFGVETNWLGSWFAMAALGCRSLLQVNNQVLNKIKIAVRISERGDSVWLMYGTVYSI